MKRAIRGEKQAAHVVFSFVCYRDNQSLENLAPFIRNDKLYHVSEKDVIPTMSTSHSACNDSKLLARR